MTPLEAVRELQQALLESGRHHYRSECLTVDGTPFGWCRFCDHRWPCDGAKLSDVAERALPQIVKALEAAEKAVAQWDADVDCAVDYALMDTVRAALKGGD